MRTDQERQREDTAAASSKENDEKISEMINDADTTRAKEADVNIDEDNPDICLNCGFKMIELKACMSRCPNCGAIKDCSEKAIW